MIIRKIYYDKATGNRLYDCSYNDVVSVNATLDQDYESILELKMRDKATIGLLVYENGEYEQDFMECGPNFTIDLETLTPLFSYPNENQTDTTPAYIKPLSLTIAEQMDYLVDVDFRLSMVELGI